MIAAKNQRVYLMLDPDEAVQLQVVLQNSICAPKKDPKVERILRRLGEATQRARDKGAQFPK